jgi:malate dehydrogenase (oxaloacetate-decarboxylating)(NADP+)
MHSERGVKILHDPVRNKGSAFSESERDALGLRGLLPPRVLPIERQMERVLEGLRRRSTDLERYMDLIALQDRNENLFYRVVVDHLEEMMPLIYTPTVGKACQEFGHIFRRPRGLWISARDRGRVAEILGNWPHEDVRIIVVTDGGRILGLGDLGADGMGIPVGKLALYTACAGIPPTQCLPITLDMGTDNQALRDDPFYVGIPQPRIRGAEYDSLLDEFVEAVQKVFPRALLQIEDFANENAFRLLERYRDRLACFDDDIQGTGAVALAGLYSALRIAGGRLRDCRFLFVGAGEAGLGIGQLLVSALRDEGLSEDDAVSRCWFVDSRGLVVASRGDLTAPKRAFAHEAEPTADLETIVRRVRPSALIGASGQPGIFTRPVLEALAAEEEHPVVFALSNPTSKAECTARQAYEWTGGRAIFASGSPFEAVEFEGRTYVPGQGNNAYVFPGVGLGAIFCAARAVTDEMFFAAARALADQVSEDDLRLGRIYPPLSQIREVSCHIAATVVRVARKRGLAEPGPDDELEARIRDWMYEPGYGEAG